MGAIFRKVLRSSGAPDVDEEPLGPRETLRKAVLEQANAKSADVQQVGGRGEGGVNGGGPCETLRKAVLKQANDMSSDVQ